MADSNKSWRPTLYSEELWGSSIKMTFPIIKILDFENREDELIKLRNPFAIIVRAQLKALTSGNEEQRLINKINIIKELFKNGYKREEIINIAIFLDSIFALSHESKLIYNDTVNTIEQEKNVSLLTTFEEIGILKGKSNVLSEQLKFKFNDIPKKYLDKIQHANENLLSKLSQRILYCNTLEQIFEE